MLEISQRLIFGGGDVLLKDLKGKVIRTFQKSDFRISERRYRVTESLLGEISGKLLIEIDVPIEVEVTFEAQINANVDGAIAHASASGAEAYATEAGAKAYANVKDAIADVGAPGAIAYANAPEDLATPLS